MSTLTMPTEVGQAFLVQLLVEYHRARVMVIDQTKKSNKILTENEINQLQDMKRERDAAETVLESLGFKVPRELDLPVIYHAA